VGRYHDQLAADPAEPDRWRFTRREIVFLGAEPPRPRLPDPGSRLDPVRALSAQPLPARVQAQVASPFAG
jgi:hypothetical protein